MPAGRAKAMPVVGNGKQTMWTKSALNDLIGAGKVSRLIYTDPELFELELRNVFGRAWVYAGHESQLRDRGDFLTTRLGRDRIIVARHSDGKLYAFHNRCAHRGAEVCQAPLGNAKSFVCPYHAWSFATDGGLEAVPLADGYGRGFGERIGDLGLERVPRLDGYRGFLFASHSPEGVELAEFLGAEVRAAFDNFIDRAPNGELERTGGKTVQVFRANWKLQIENSIDLLHPGILHLNAITAANALKRELGADSAGQVELEATRANGLTLKEWDVMRIAALPRGHCWMGGFLKEAIEGEDERPQDGQPLLPWQIAYRKKLSERHGREKAREVLSFSRHNTIVYPNLFVNPGIQQIRTLQPTAVDRTEQHGYIFRLGGAPAELFHTAVRVLSSVNSPSSIVTTDDHEVFERMQEGMASGERDGLDWSRGLDTEKPGADGVLTGEGTNEMLMRNQHRAWLSYMTGAA